MLINLHHGNAAEHRRLLICGVLFLSLIAGFIGFSIAVYSKVFESTTMVTIKADRAGLQLAKFGDVRMNGVLVGQVRAIEQDGKEASIKVGLDPESARKIPENIEVQILPTTLFGQKYIALVPPESPVRKAIADGDVIPSERVETNVELSRILADLFPLLRSIRPADLQATLNALATALAGRGEEIGTSLEKLSGYLSAIDQDLPALRDDLVLLADVADTYDLAAPDLLSTLRQLTVTGETVLDHKSDLETLFTDLTGLARTSTSVLAENEANLIRVGDLAEKVTSLLATYSPEFPCLLKGLDRYTDNLNDMFAGGRVKQYVELGAVQREPYKVEDRPKYGDVGHGPWCAGLPYPEVPYPTVVMNDGDNRSIDKTSPLNILTGQAFGVGFSGTRPEQQIVSALLSARTGVAMSEVPAMTSLLYGPLVKGPEREVAG
ncbi:MCE family protein [Nocardioides daejeonensis]|uniref:MCE family protein n=1 Tax=Nocardioides daejeonensis TaxID=1046556 RepID=UPI000D74F43D|nr:MCE family protein [Nocardioides daejeonensis]